MMQDRAYREIEGQAERLGIVEPAKGDAVFYLETAYSLLVSQGGGWHTVEIVAAACLYAAVRNNTLPVSIAETAAAIGKPRHIVGAAYKVLLKTLQLSMPAFVDFSKYIQRHIAKLGPLHNSNKQVKKFVSAVMIMCRPCQTAYTAVAPAAHYNNHASSSESIAEILPFASF